MKRKSNMYRVLSCVLAVTMFMCGCGNGNSGVSNQNENNIKQEDITCVIQSISLPEYTSFDGAYSDGDDLYYAAAKFDQDS